jgi:hypothetical protein
MRASTRLARARFAALGPVAMRDSTQLICR